MIGAGVTPALEGTCRVLSGCGFPAPGTQSFEFSPMFSLAGYEVTKPVFLLVLSTAAIAALVIVAFRRPALVPRGLQNAMEVYYDFIRIGIARDVIGRDGERFAPYLGTLFLFVFLLNFLEIVPGAQFPVTSKIAFPAVLSALTWLIFNYLGVRRHGFFGYLKHVAVPSGLPKPLYLLITPIEFVSTIIIRPFTLAVRLFANMFAGHLLLLIFTLGTTYLLVPRIQGIFAVVSFGMTFVLTGFELLIQFLQAYIITLLTATYIAGALDSEH